ncbi:MAG: hypothetical protein ACI38Z_04555 [Parafannyhessea sp.]
MPWSSTGSLYLSSRRRRASPRCAFAAAHC